MTKTIEELKQELLEKDLKLKKIENEKNVMDKLRFIASSRNVTVDELLANAEVAEKVKAYKIDGNFNESELKQIIESHEQAQEYKKINEQVRENSIKATFEEYSKLVGAKSDELLSDFKVYCSENELDYSKPNALKLYISIIGNRFPNNKTNDELLRNAGNKYINENIQPTLLNSSDSSYNSKEKVPQGIKFDNQGHVIIDADFLRETNNFQSEADRQSYLAALQYTIERYNRSIKNNNQKSRPIYDIYMDAVNAMREEI